MTTQETTQAPAAFISSEVEAAWLETLGGAFKSHFKADQNLVRTLLTSARDIGRPVDEADWDTHLVKPARKAIKAKVGADSVKVYVFHAKWSTIAATGRPPVCEALPLGKHWADQLTNGRKPEGINAYIKRVKPLVEMATRNDEGHLILPEGYSLLGVPPAAATPAADTPATTEAATGSAGASQDAEGGLNVSPEAAKAAALEAAATVLMGNAKAAAALLALLADKAGKEALAKLMGEHAKAKAQAEAKAAADAKAGEALNKAA